MTISEDLRAFLLADPLIQAAIGDNCGAQYTPQGEKDGIQFMRSSTDNDETRCLSQPGTDVQFSESWDVEAVSLDPERAFAIAGLLKLKDSHIGAFGSGQVQGIFVRDHNDQYNRIAAGSDDARHVAAVEFEIFGYEGS